MSKLAADCKHMNFHASVRVARLEDKGLFMAEVHVECADCKLPFQFVGVDPGLDLHGCRVSVDGLELNAAIAPQGSVLSPLDRITVNIGGPVRRPDA